MRHYSVIYTLQIQNLLPTSMYDDILMKRLTSRTTFTLQTTANAAAKSPTQDITYFFTLLTSQTRGLEKKCLR